MTTPQEYLEKQRQKAALAFQIRPEDGLLSIVAKTVFGCRCWRFVVHRTVPLILETLGKLTKNYESEEIAEGIARRAIDGHILLMTILLMTAYLLTFYLFGAGVGCCGMAVVVFCVAFSVYRLGEIFSIFVQLHLKGGYHSTAPARAVLNTLWHYLEFTIAFGTFYVIAAKLTEDSFVHGDGSLLGCVVNPLYFSFVTITTLGYGDYSPKEPLGNSLVWVEVFCGLLLILIVIQRAISASMARNSQNGSTGSSDQQDGVSK